MKHLRNPAFIVALSLFGAGFGAATAQTGSSKEAAKPAATAPAPAAANTFNRLMKPAGERNLPPTQDGIHDPGSAGTRLLQPPQEAISRLAPASGGNYVDWVKSLQDGQIAPRFDKAGSGAKPVLMDLNIVREVKGLMPDVVYPHKQHTEWLDCSNCHPAIFVPKKGENNISMASIIMGEKCGVCHGKVAFPISDCRRCHSRKKGTAPAPAATAAPAR